MKYVIGPIGRLPFRWRESYMTGQIDADGNNVPDWKAVLAPWVQALPKRARAIFDIEGSLGAAIYNQDLSAMNEGRVLLLRAQALRPDCQFGAFGFPSSEDVYLPEDIDRDMDRAENQANHFLQYANFTCQHIYLSSDHNFRYLDHNLNVTLSTGLAMPVDLVWWHRYPETDPNLPLGRVPKEVLQEWLNFAATHIKKAGFVLPNWHLWFEGMMDYMRYSTLNPFDHATNPARQLAIRAAILEFEGRYSLPNMEFNATLAQSDLQAEMAQVIGWADEVI